MVGERERGALAIVEVEAHFARGRHQAERDRRGVGRQRPQLARALGRILDAADRFHLDGFAVRRVGDAPELRARFGGDDRGRLRLARLQFLP